MPEASRLAGAGSSPGMKIKPLIQSAVKGLFVAATPVYCILFAFAGPLTQLWLGHSFNAMVPSTLRFFLIGTFLSLLGTPYYYVLIGLGRAQYVLWANAWQFCVCIGGVLTILSTGVIGRSVELLAVLATADVAMAVSTCLLVLFTKRELGRYEETSSLAEAIAA
jgi:O-antigen/teichoic acid export membrane protein